MMGPILAGLGLIVVGGGYAIHSSWRRAVPTDVRAQIISTLASGGDMTALAKAYDVQGNPSRHQLKIVLTAVNAADQDKTLAADVAALYKGALRSGTPATMKQVATQLSPKHNHLASLLNDVAKILGG